ncbi:MAG: hypothetical protein WDA68_05125 [Phycisphaerae bacterium]
MERLLNTVKIALILAVIVLAIVGTLYVLDVFTTEAAKEVLAKLMKIIGIWTGTSLVVLLVALLGTKKSL